jgi:hypothetical protein
MSSVRRRRYVSHARDTAAASFASSQSYECATPIDFAEDCWLPPRDSNPDMLIQSPFPDSENKQNPATHSADSGKLLQNPHRPRTNKKGEL